MLALLPMEVSAPEFLSWYVVMFCISLLMSPISGILVCPMTSSSLTDLGRTIAFSVFYSGPMSDKKPEGNLSLFFFWQIPENFIHNLEYRNFIWQKILENSSYQRLERIKEDRLRRGCLRSRKLQLDKLVLTFMMYRDSSVCHGLKISITVEFLKSYLSTSSMKRILQFLSAWNSEEISKITHFLNGVCLVFHPWKCIL